MAVVVGGLAWACTPSGFGTPSQPAEEGSPPPSDPATSGSQAPPAEQQPSTQPSQSAPPAEPATRTTTSASGTTSGALPAKSRPQPERPVARPKPAAPVAIAPVIQARQNGATAGVSTQGTQVVFNSSKAPAKADRKKAAAPAPTLEPQADPRTATDDVWADLAAPKGSALAAAEAASVGGKSGVGTGVIIGLGLLTVGLSALAGAAIATAGRRRKAGRTAR